MRVRKVTVKKGVLAIGYEEKSERRKGEWDGFALACKDDPLTSFYRAFQGMNLPAGKILGVSEKWALCLKVGSVVIDYSEDGTVKTVAVSVEKDLEEGLNAAALRFTVPAVAALEYDDVLPKLEEEAERYVRGDRAQPLLIPEKEAGQAEKDSLVERAKAIIFETQRATTAMIQRRLHIGYTAAAEIMDKLEALGIVGPPRGSEPREILAAPASLNPKPATGQDLAAPAA